MSARHIEISELASLLAHLSPQPQGYVKLLQTELLSRGKVGDLRLCLRSVWSVRVQRMILGKGKDLSSVQVAYRVFLHPNRIAELHC